MTDAVTFDVPGLADMLAELSRLPEVMQRRVVRGAVATGCSVIRREVAARAPEFTGDVAQGHPPPGTLKRAVYQARLVDQCTGTAEVWTVGVRAGKRQRADAFYARWVEYGHYTRTPAGPGTRAARRAVARASGTARWVPARPYFRPAFDAKRNEAMQAMQDYITENLPLAAASFRYIQAIAT